MKQLLLSLSILLLLTACVPAQGAPEKALQNAAQTFVEGYNVRDLSGLDALFASPAQGADELGLDNTRKLAQELVANSKPGDTIELEGFSTTRQSLDEANRLAVVHYDTRVVITNGGVIAFVARAQQNVALTLVGGRWLISGGDIPQVTIEHGSLP